MCHYRAHWRREKIYWAGERRRGAAGKRWMMIRQSFLPARYLSRWWCCCGCFSNKRVYVKSLHCERDMHVAARRCATRRSLTHWNFTLRSAPSFYWFLNESVYGCKWIRRIHQQIHLSSDGFLIAHKIMKLSSMQSPMKAGYVLSICSSTLVLKQYDAGDLLIEHGTL